MPDIPPDTIIARFDSLTEYWIAHFPATPQVAFGGNLPMLSVRRLLDGTEANPDTHLVHYDRSEIGNVVRYRTPSVVSRKCEPRVSTLEPSTDQT
jgi:hypothetical protein